ncbi:MAG: aldehyde ferredoxin oxidoreductase family protein [Chloroflexota bacterium]
MPGWMGKILRVDLSRNTHRVEPLDLELQSNYIGGRGMAARLLFDEVDPQVDPFSSENKLVLATGPLTGTGAITGCKYAAVTKSPLTGAIASSTAEGFFGTELKYAGYDAVVLEGKAAEPVYLEVFDGRVEVLPAGHLWGLRTSQTEDIIRARMHDRWKARDVCVACIGPAGEKLARMATLVNDRHWAASRSGVGAVMGSKNLKAIVVSGTQDIALASGKPFMDVVLAFLEQVKAMPLSSRTLPEQGTAFMIEMMDELGVLATRNFQAGVFPGVGGLNGEALRRTVTRQMGCFSCPIGCEHLVRLGPGKGVGMAPGYDALASLGPCCGVGDLEAVLGANHLCLELGLDPVSTGGTIACAMELFEKGVLTEREVGLPLRFGDARVLLELVEGIGLRRGFGEVLAEGACRLAERYGHPELFMGVKGQECPPCDPRGIQGLGLQYATSNSGASYDSGDVLVAEVLGLQEALDPAEVQGKAALVKGAQDLAALLDSCGLCRRILLAGMGVMEIFAMMEMVTAVGLNDQDLLRAGERVFNLERLFNLRAGLDSRDDALPRRMLEEPLAEGKARGQVSRLPEMLPEYYELRGWDGGGVPTPEKLAGLGLAAEAAVR